MMQVFIMRHGEASYEAASDAVRPLTSRGCEEARQVAQWLDQQNHIEQVLVSPYLRAQQTWETVHSELSRAGKERVLTALTPEGSIDLVVGELQMLTLQGCRSVLLVSHLPLVDYLVQELCVVEHRLRFPTASIALLTIEGDLQGKLICQVTPGERRVNTEWF